MQSLHSNSASCLQQDKIQSLHRKQWTYWPWFFSTQTAKFTCELEVNGRFTNSFSLQLFVFVFVFVAPEALCTVTSLRRDNIHIRNIQPFSLCVCMSRHLQYFAHSISLLSAYFKTITPPTSSGNLFSATLTFRSCLWTLLNYKWTDMRKLQPLVESSVSLPVEMNYSSNYIFRI